MDLLRVAGATINQTPLDFSGNRQRIVALLTEARRLGVELLVLPELSLTGYGCEDAFFSLSTVAAAEAEMQAILPATKALTVVLGLPHYYYGGLYNCAAVIQDGKVLGINAKRVLPREGLHYEPRWFRPWTFGKVVETRFLGERVPLGDLRYRLGDVGVAIEICEEAWASVPASAAHADAVDLILNPSASHFALGKYEKREHLVANSSRSMQVIYVYTNLVGLEAGRVIYDGGVLIAEGGAMIARGRRFGFADGEITFRDINPALARQAKLKAKPVDDRENTSHARPYTAAAAAAGSPSGSHPSSEVFSDFAAEIQGKDPRLAKTARSAKNKIDNKVDNGTLVKRAQAPRTDVANVADAANVGDAAPTQKSTAPVPVGEDAPLTREAEFLYAETLGLFDYLRKSHAQGFVLSLSGGCDSAACAVLVGHMVAQARAELGARRFAARLGIAPLAAKKDVASDIRSEIQRLLTCVYQKTAHSGPVTQAAATAVAAALGAKFHLVDVQPMVDCYRQAAETALGRPLRWDGDDLTLQNLQARARGPLVWALANAESKLLLTTSNRSEAAVGYATMDGDTAGGLAPLAGIDKPFLRAWLGWAERDCSYGLGPLASLSLVNSQAPTAELRPPDQRQSDETDLMPYAVLERIERYFVRDRLGPADIAEALGHAFPEIPAPTLNAYLSKFFRLWAGSQWKRERLAPSFHLDDESLDPKTWCRFPILSAPYQLS